MAFNIYDTHTLLTSVSQMPPTHTFLLDRYFPTNEATDIFTTTDVLVEYRKGTQKAAPWVAPRKGGITVERGKHQMRQLTPSKIAPERTMTIDDLNKRGFGEALYTNLTPQQRQGVMVVNDIHELRLMIARRKEKMASDVIFTGGCIMDEYVDDLGTHEAAEVRFYDGASNPGTYTPAADWDTTEAAGKQILADAAAMIAMNTRRGIAATEFLLAPDVADVFLANAWILKLLDNRNYMIGGVDPELLPSGVAKIARLNIKGHMVDFLTYDESYEEMDGTMVPYLPAGHIALAAPAAGRTVYGGVNQVEQSDGEFHTYRAKEVPKYISDANNDVRKIRLTSAPLCVPNNESPFIVAEVLGGD